VGSRWLQDRRNDRYFKEAKKQGYRARSAFKLKQLNEKHNFLHEGDSVVDLGCAPGGWSQVLVEIVGDQGLVVGVDLERTRPVEGATFLRGDFTDRDTHDQLGELLKESGRLELDAVVSDMAPDMTGTYGLDQARSVYLCEMGLDFADGHLRLGGTFLTKIFEGTDFQEFRELMRARFRKVRMAHPAASRKASSEVYLLGLGFEGAPASTEEE
jgi:23S rRNA (uridine2552-2'-O)-methyltransferase